MCSVARLRRPRPQQAQVVDVAPAVAEVQAAPLVVLPMALLPAVQPLQRPDLVARRWLVQADPAAVLPVVAADAPLVPQRPSNR
jgi:hypothetical protein